MLRFCNSQEKTTVSTFHAIDLLIVANLPIWIMISERRGPAFPGRGIPAIIIACLLFFQLLANAALAQSHTSGPLGFETSSPFAVAGFCTDHSESAPSQKHHKHSDCCVFCKAGGRDHPFLLPVATPGFTVAVRRPTYAEANKFVDELANEPVGWASSWSSRAPPGGHAPSRG